MRGAPEPDKSAERCEQVERAADEQVAVIQAAEARAAKARVLFGTPRRNLSNGSKPLGARMAESGDAMAAMEGADAAVQEELRMFAQIVVGDSECFPPELAADARNKLGQ